MVTGFIMSRQQKLILIEEAARLCGWKLPAFEAMLEKPVNAPGRPKYLHKIDEIYIDLYEVKKYIKRSQERQLQAPIVTDDVLLEKLEVIKHQHQGTKNAAIVVLSSFAALRVGEIASLKITDVMDDNGEIKNQSHLYRNLTKTRKCRTIFLADPNLKKYLLPYVQQRCLDTINSDSPLFVTPRGHKYTGNNLAQHIKRVYKEVGLPNLSSHSGRAATAKRYLSKGKTLKFVSEVLGHSSVATTAKYDRVSNDEILQAMAQG